jgi:ubiquinone/menaquinone biosynthesis C-methylase UbiE
MTVEESAREIFGRRAEFYVNSDSHTDKATLERLVALARPAPADRVLDVACGTGHTALALAPLVGSVVGIDLTAEMLDRARRLAPEAGAGNLEFRQGDVHALPFDAGSFDLVTCRRGAHHFGDIERALAEMRRVLAPGGRLVVDDRSVPEDDRVDVVMNRLDLLHDNSHVREYRPSEWRQMLAAGGFALEALETYERSRPLVSLTEDVATRDVAEIHAIVKGLSDEVRAAMGIAVREGETFITHWYLVLAAARP